MKIYTKTGDKGYTSLIGGVRVPKYSIRIESYGNVDELNSYVGMIVDQGVDGPKAEILKQIQVNLFKIGALLASDPDKSRMKVPEITVAEIEVLEREIDTMTSSLPELRHFILPGGSVAVSFCHIARCVCRRAERIAVQLSEESFVDELVIIYLNRLSDFLFVLARKLAFDSGIEENKWLP